MKKVITIEVNLLGNLMWCPDKKQKKHNLQTQEKIEIDELLEKFNVAVEQVNYIAKNGQIVPMDTILELKEGDLISISPIIFGG